MTAAVLAYYLAAGTLLVYLLAPVAGVRIASCRTPSATVLRHALLVALWPLTGTVLVTLAVEADRRDRHPSVRSVPAQRAPRSWE